MRHLVIMAKEPIPGRVKTRLAADMGRVAATWWFRHQCAALVRRVGQDPRWTTWLAVAPDRALASGALPGGVRRLAQGSGDLGARMARVLATLSPGPVLVIGADIPGVTPARIWEGFGALAGNVAVFGPATDGGYWMIGVGRGKQPGAGFLRGVRWSSEHALADSINSLGPERSVGFAATLRDVDTAADLKALPRH